MNVDWEKDVATKTSEIVPDGFYICKVKDWEYSKSKSKGTEQVMWTLEVAQGDYAGNPIWDFHALLKQSMWRLGAFIKGCAVDTTGMNGKKVEVPSPIFDAVLDACKGRLIGCNVTVEEYKGKKNNKIPEYTTVEKKEVKPNVHSADDVPEFLTTEEPPEADLI